MEDVPNSGAAQPAEAPAETPAATPENTPTDTPAATAAPAVKHSESIPFAGLFPGVALVTGAGSGTGRCIAFALANAGCRKLALTDTDRATLIVLIQVLRREHPDIDIFAEAGKSWDEDFATSFVDKVYTKFKSLNYCFNYHASGPKQVWKDEPQTGLPFDECNRTYATYHWFTRVEAKGWTEMMDLKFPFPFPQGPQDVTSHPECIVNVLPEPCCSEQLESPLFHGTNAAIEKMSQPQFQLRGQGQMSHAAHNSAQTWLTQVRTNCVLPGTGTFNSVSNYFNNIALNQNKARVALFLGCGLLSGSVNGQTMDVDGSR